MENDTNEIKDLLEAEFDKIEEDAPEEEVVEASAEEPEPEADPEPETEEAKEEVEEPVQAKTTEDPVDKKPVEKVKSKAPIGFSPEAREEWSNVPKKVQDQIVKREKEIAQAMQNTSDARKTHEIMTNFLHKNHAVLTAGGNPNPFNEIENIVSNVAQLRMGSPVQKADLLADLIDQYGVDIQTLDQVLTKRMGGEVPAQEGQANPVQQNDSLQRMLDERLAPVNDLLSGLKDYHSQTTQQTQANTQQSIAEFSQDPANEFFEDVKADMADIFDLATKRGQKLSLKEAYDKAVALHPEISKVLSSRNNAQKVIQKKNASSSVSSVNTREPSKNNSGNDLRSSILDAWDVNMG